MKLSHVVGVRPYKLLYSYTHALLNRRLISVVVMVARIVVMPWCGMTPTMSQSCGVPVRVGRCDVTPILVCREHPAHLVVAQVYEMSHISVWLVHCVQILEVYAVNPCCLMSCEMKVGYHLVCHRTRVVSDLTVCHCCGRSCYRYYQCHCHKYFFHNSVFFNGIAFVYCFWCKGNNNQPTPQSIFPKCNRNIPIHLGKSPPRAYPPHKMAQM